jgi:ABC-2 type transport system ATP-binding protein
MNVHRIPSPGAAPAEDRLGAGKTNLTLVAPAAPAERAGGPAEDAGRPTATCTQGVPAVMVENLVKDYRTSRAVNDVSFTVARGATVGLLGGNGAGKSTTIAMIMGLVLPSAGRVVVLGHDMTRSPQKVLHRVNFMSPYVGMPARLTVRQNLNVFGRLYGVSRLPMRIAQLAEEFDLFDVLDRPAGRLSAGQKTRVALAKALLNEPDLLLLDEPTASLDPDWADWMRGRLEAYRAARGAAILLASHNMAEVERLCDQVVIMSRGRIVESGAPAELVRRYGCRGLDEVFIDIARAQYQGLAVARPASAESSRS